jgi:hypothetical protein
MAAHDNWRKLGPIADAAQKAADRFLVELAAIRPGYFPNWDQDRGWLGARITHCGRPATMKAIFGEQGIWRVAKSERARSRFGAFSHRRAATWLAPHLA